MEAGTLLETYISRGGKDLGEFLVGTSDRRAIEPPPNDSYLVGNFSGVQQQLGTNYAGLCREIEMKGSSLKRMIGNNEIDKGDTVGRCVEKLGLPRDSAQEAMFWYLARGDKALPTVEKIVDAAKKELGKDGADPQKIARNMAITLFNRSGFTQDRFGELVSRDKPHHHMIKELTRNEGYSFSPERAEAFAKAISLDHPAQTDTISNILLGLDRKKHVATLIAELEGGKLDFGGLVKQVRTQRHQTQAEFGESFTKFLAKEKCIEPSPAVSQSMVEKWELNHVVPQGNAMGDALAKFLRFDPDHYHLVPRVPDKGVPVEERVKPEVWMERIRGGELTFTNYIKTLLQEEGRSYASFGKSIPYHDGKGVNESFVSGWTKGRRANGEHAAALAARAGYTEESDRKDFIAFARTGRLKRSDPDKLLDMLLSGEMPLAEFVQQLRTEEGQSPEEFDRHMGLGKGTARNMESGRELRSRGAQSFADHMPYKDARKDAFRDRLTRKGEIGESGTGLDPEGYRKMIDASMEHAGEQNLILLRAETSGIRFNHKDAVIERWWRAMAADHAKDDIVKTGHVSPSAIDGWNDLHDLLFDKVNPARFTSRTFKDHVERITEYLRDRDDDGSARHAMLATIIRAAIDKDPDQREDLAHIAGLLNMKFLQHTIEIECHKYHPPPDAAEAWAKVYDNSRSVITHIRISNFAKMDAYFRAIVHNAVIGLGRHGKHHDVQMDDELLDYAQQTATTDPDTSRAAAPDVLRILDAAKSRLSENERQLLESLLTADPDQKGMYHRIATDLGIPEGTVKSRLYALRAALADMPEVMDALGDVFGSSYVNDIESRRKRGNGGHHGEHGAHQDDDDEHGGGGHHGGTRPGNGGTRPGNGSGGGRS